ncbi:MAG: hypothetical protein ACOX66_01320 [Oscillospiraceae bacterium]|jgi:cell shape-determining protein MreD
MLLDLINIEKVRRAIVWFGVMLLVLLLQNEVLGPITVLGTHFFIAPVALAVMACCEGGVWGCVFGLFLGLFCDMYGNGPVVLLTVVFPILGFICGAAAAFFVNKRFFAVFFVSLTACLVTALCQMFRFAVFAGSPLGPLLLTALLQTALALPFTWLFYDPFRRVAALRLDR